MNKFKVKIVDNIRPGQERVALKTSSGRTLRFNRSTDKKVRMLVREVDLNSGEVDEIRRAGYDVNEVTATAKKSTPVVHKKEEISG